MNYDYIVETENLTKYYNVAGSIIKALDGINLKILRGEYVTIIGPSGSGKTTLFNIVGGLSRPTRGKVFIDKIELSRLDAYELAWIRCHKIGYIFQTFNLIPTLTALENVALPMVFAGLLREDRLKRGKELLKSVGLGNRLYHKPMQLSAGEQQRVALARALANNPLILLADEPTGNLDFHTGREIVMMLRNINKERGVTMMAATHDVKMIDVSNRVIWIRDGKIERISKPEEYLELIKDVKRGHKTIK